VNLTILKWIATAMLIAGATTTSMNVYPLNIVLNTLGGILWTTAGVLMKDKPLITVNAVLTLIYGSGALYAVYI
jgi:hypothetical protein